MPRELPLLTMRVFAVIVITFVITTDRHAHLPIAVDRCGSIHDKTPAT
jgi:hypothetical protein